MQLIPVLDLKDGLVVRGAGGKRESYRPIETPLAPSAQPRVVAEALIAASSATTLYIADLDAIMGGAAQTAILRALFDALPEVTFWLDAGFSRLGAADALRDHLGIKASDKRFVPVLGSETLEGLKGLGAVERGGRFVLSLDFGEDGYRGPDVLVEQPSLWPRDVIVMSLKHVGSGEGPDVNRLHAIVGQAGARRIHAAGGVRDAADIEALEAMGVSGALVSSALHDGRLDGR